MINYHMTLRKYCWIVQSYANSFLVGSNIIFLLLDKEKTKKKIYDIHIHDKKYI